VCSSITWGDQAKKLSVAVPEPVGVDTIEAAPVKAIEIEAKTFCRVTA